MKRKKENKIFSYVVTRLRRQDKTENGVEGPEDTTEEQKRVKVSKFRDNCLGVEILRKELKKFTATGETRHGDTVS